MTLKQQSGVKSSQDERFFIKFYFVNMYSVGYL